MDCPTTVLEDDPTCQDDFGVHSRVAEVLAQAIRSAPAGSACLVGEWGSGKSSIIHMVRALLGEDGCRSIVFIFDAWAHQGDPLRRAFLASFLELLESKGCVTPATKESTVKALAGVEKVAVAEHRTVLTPLGAWVIAVVAVFGVLSTALALLARLAPAPAFPWVFGLFLFLAVTPLTFVGLLYIWTRHKSRENGDAASRDVLAAFISRPPTEVLTRSFEPSQLDTHAFEKIFRGLVRGAIGDDAERRVVIVVDNLDRLPPETARQVWATMQTFDTRNSSLDSNAPTWLVVPIAEEAAESLWTGQASPADVKGGEPRRDISHSMLTKTFQIRLDVPQLVRTDFGDYFVGRFREALPAHEDDAAGVLRVYQVLRPSLVWRTPREVKRFLNELVVVHRQVGDGLPIRTQALYVVARNKRVPIDELILGPREYGPLVEDDEWREHLAALAYGVDPSKTIQVLLEPRLREALRQGSVSDTFELSGVAGYWDVLADAVSAELQVVEPDSVESLVARLRPLLEWSRFADAPTRCEIIAGVALAVEACTSWTPAVEDASVLGLLVADSLHPERCLEVLYELAAASEVEASLAPAWAAGMNAFILALPASLRSAAIDRYSTPGDQQTQLALIEAFDLPDRVVPRRKLVSRLSADSVGRSYPELIASAGPRSHEAFRAETLLGAGLVEPGALAEAVINRIAQRTEDGLDEMVGLWSVLTLVMLRGADVEQPAKQLAADAHLSYWADSALENSNKRAEAVVFLLGAILIDAGDSWRTWPAVGRSQELFTVLDDSNLAPALMKVCYSLICGAVGSIFNREGSLNGALLAGSVSACPLENITVDRALAISVRGILTPASTARLAEALVPRLPLVMRRPFDPRSGQLYLAISERDLDRSQAAFAAFIVAGLRSRYTASAWREAIVNGGPASALLVKYAAGLSNGLGTEFCSGVTTALFEEDDEIHVSLSRGFLLELASVSDPGGFDRALCKALRLEAGDWRIAGRLLGDLSEKFMVPAVARALSATQTEELLGGLASTGRLADASICLVLISAAEIRGQLSGAAKRRLRGVVREQLKKRIRSPKRKECLANIHKMLG